MVVPYSGNFMAVGGFSFFGGNDFGGGGKTKSGNFTAGKLPTIDEEKSERISLFPHDRRKGLNQDDCVLPRDSPPELFT